MKVCIFGAGAVGGHIATRLIAANADEVSVVARGAVLEAIRARGFTLRSGGQEIAARPEKATDDPSTLPAQDLVIVTLKAHAVSAAAGAIAQLIAPQGCAVFLLNGVPWWWRHGLPASGPLPLLDPDGALWTQVRPERALGCVVHQPNEVIAPGIIVHTGPNHLIVGEPDGSVSTRLEAAIALFARGGIEAKLSTDLRRDVLLKLVLNASASTLCALTRADQGTVSIAPELKPLLIRVMHEVVETAVAMGWDLRADLSIEALTGVGKRGMRPSMLQDVLKGRPLEVEALLGQIHAFAHEARVPVPAMDVILPLLRGLDASVRAAC